MTASREALIIATGTYEDAELRRLRAPSQDAAALARVLSDPAIGSFEVRSVVDQSSSVVGLAAEEFFADRGLDDLLVLHLSCHGVKDDDGRLFFAATDTKKNRLKATAVSATLLNDLMEHCRARSIVMLLDCCYSGAFVSGVKGDEGVHLKEKFEGQGRAILTASNAIEYSWEGNDLSGEGAPSVFTAAIVQGLESGDADRDRDGMVSIDDLYKHVYDRVRAVRPGQTPKMWALGIERDLYIAHNPRPIKVEPAALPPELQMALESPLSSVREGIVQDLARLLAGSHPGLSLAAQEALEQLRNDDSRRVADAAGVVLESRPRAEHASAQPTPPVEQDRTAREEPKESPAHGGLRDWLEREFGPAPPSPKQRARGAEGQSAEERVAEVGHATGRRTAEERPAEELAADAERPSVGAPGEQETEDASGDRARPAAKVPGRDRRRVVAGIALVALLLGTVVSGILWFGGREDPPPPTDQSAHHPTRHS